MYLRELVFDELVYIINIVVNMEKRRKKPVRHPAPGPVMPVGPRAEHITKRMRKRK